VDQLFSVWRGPAGAAVASLPLALSALALDKAEQHKGQPLSHRRAALVLLALWPGAEKQTPEWA
jgi:hypothetical protein